MFLLVPAYPGSAGQKAVKRLCVCVQQQNLIQVKLMTIASEETYMCSFILY